MRMITTPLSNTHTFEGFATLGLELRVQQIQKLLEEVKKNKDTVNYKSVFLRGLLVGNMKFTIRESRGFQTI